MSKGEEDKITLGTYAPLCSGDLATLYNIPFDV
jgi:hypothetical protein